MASKRRTRRDFGTVRKKGKRFYAEYTGLDGAQHTPGHSFANRTDADGWLAAERRLMDLEAWIPPKQRAEKEKADSLTVAEWLDQFHSLLETGANPLKPTTMQNYRNVTRRRITQPIAPGDMDDEVTRLASMRLTELTKNDVYRWWDAVQHNYKSATTNQQAYKRLKAAYAEAVRREMVSMNPVDIKKAGERVKTKDKYLPSDEEIDKILDGMNDRYKALTSLVLHHGVRVGEAIALEVRHVHVNPVPGNDTPKVTVTIEQAIGRLSPGDKNTHLIVQPPKTDAAFREVPIFGMDVPYFLNHLEKYVDGKTTTVRTVDGEKEVQLFTKTEPGRMVMDTSYRSALDRVKEAVGVNPRITPHTGRNWLITRLAELGAQPKEIGELLGQADMETIVNVYMKVRAGRTTSLMDKVNDSLGKV